MKRRKKPVTPRSRVKRALGTVWLYSRERSEALRLSAGHCAECKQKFKRTELEVHHLQAGDTWEGVIDYIYRHLLVEQDKLTVLCHSCHIKEHSDEASL